MNTLKLKNDIFKIFIEILIWNKRYRSKIKSRWVKLHLKKYVNKAIKETAIPTNVNKGNNKIIWQYWHQGVENAPTLIQKCFESIKKYHPDYDIRIVTFDTIEKYTKIPKKYYDLLEQKKIPIAIFSDILRLYLLSEYGGTWIDSTIYLTEKIPQEILDSDFLVLQKDPKIDNFEDKMSCFFIRGNADNIWVHLIKNSLENYWAENDYLIHYFIFEHVVTMLSESSPELKKDWENMKYYSAEDTGLLQRKFFEEYDEKEFNLIKEKTSIHKLTYKKDSIQTSGNTFLDKILE